MISLKAVIMAGGMGSRLYPITKTMPKPLVPIMGTPVMAYTLALLKKYGITECAVTTRYLGRMIRERFCDEFCGVKLFYSEEAKPLGTAGGVAAAMDSFLSEGDRDLLIMSGDALTDVRLDEAMAFHEKNGSDVTMILKRLSDPTSYGVVMCDGATGRIERFSEKPDWSSVFSDRVNTGMYIIKSSILRKLDKDSPSDFSKDLFPRLLAEGKKMFGWVMDGYWSDIGTLASFYKSNYDVLYGRMANYLPEIYKKDKIIFRDGTRSFFGKGAVVDEDVFKNGGGRNVIAGKGSVIASGAVIKDTILFDGAVMDRDARAVGAVIASGAVIGEGAIVPRGCVVGGKTEIGNDVILLPDTLTEPYSSVSSSSHVPFDGKGIVRRSEDGIVLGIRGVMTQDRCAKVGYGLVSSLFPKEEEKKRICITCSKELYGIGEAVGCGCMWQGAEVSLIYPCERTLSAFSAWKKGMKTVHLEYSGDDIVMHIFDESSLEVPYRVEEAFISAMKNSSESFDRAFGTVERDAVTVREYRSLVDSFLMPLKNGKCSEHTFTVRGGDISARILEGAINEMGFSVKEQGESSIEIDITSDGRECSISVFGERISFDRLRLLLLRVTEPKDLKEGILVISSDDPSVFSAETEKAGFLPLVYSRTFDNIDNVMKQSAYESLWMRDGTLLAARIIGLIAQKTMDKESLDEMLSSLPSVGTAVYEIGSVDRARTMARLYEAVRASGDFFGRDSVRAYIEDSFTSPLDGIEISFASTLYPGRVRVRARRDDGIRLFAESVSVEAASELCNMVKNKLSASSDKQI